MKKPTKLRVELTSLLPRWICYVTDDLGTANGGFFKGFRSHEEMRQWLAKNQYELTEST